MTRLTIGYCPNLTDPHAENIDVGILTLNEETFVSFEWTVDPERLDLCAFAREVFAGWPSYVKILIDEDWPGFKDQGPNDGIVDYLCHVLRYSSLFVSKVSWDLRVWALPGVGEA